MVEQPQGLSVKKLYLDLLQQSTADEEGTIYRFEVLIDEKATAPADGEFWFPVTRIVGTAEPS